MPSRNTLEIIIQGDDKASRTIDGISHSLTNLGQVATIAVAGAVTAATGAVVGFAAKSLAEFQTFQKGMAEVFTLLPGISADAMGKLEQDVQNLAAQFGTLPNDVIPAVYQAISAGVPSDNVFEFMSVASQAAIGGVTDLQTAVDGITSVVNAYGSEVLSAQNASDLLFTAVRLGKTDFTQLSASLFNVVPTAASLGVGLEQVTASLAAMTAQGTPTSVATTQLRQLFVELSKDGSKLSDKFKEISGKSFTEFIKGGGDVGSALQNIRAALGNNDDEFRNLFGSVEAMNAALQISGDSFDTYINALNEMGNSTGATEAAFETMSKTIQFQANRLQAKLSNLFINFGRKLEPFAAAALENIGDVVSVLDDFLNLSAADFAAGDFGDFGNMFRDFLIPLKEQFDNITAIVQEFFNLLGAGVDPLTALTQSIGLFADIDLANQILQIGQAVGSLFTEIGKLLQPVIQWVQENVKLQDVLIPLAISIASVVIPAVVGLIGAIVGFLAPIAAIIGAVALLRTAWENDFLGIRTFILDKVLPALRQLAEWFLNTALPAIITFIQTEAIPFFERIATTIGQIWQLVRPGLENLAKWFLEDALPSIVSFIEKTVIPLIGDWINLIAGIWREVGNVLGQFLEWFITTGLPIAIEWIEKAWKAFNDLLGIIGILWQNAQPALEDLKNGVTRIFTWIKDNVIKPVIDIINSIPDTINRIKTEVERVAGEIGNFVSNINLNPFTGSGFLANTFLGYANGINYVPRDMTVRVHRGEAIIPARENTGEGRGNTTNNFTIQINAPMTKEQANSTVDNMLDALRRAGLEPSR